jgi:uncharacterized membrane protein (DUF106 family)
LAVKTKKELQELKDKHRAAKREGRPKLKKEFEQKKKEMQESTVLSEGNLMGELVKSNPEGLFSR